MLLFGRNNIQGEPEGNIIRSHSVKAEDMLINKIPMIKNIIIFFIVGLALLKYNPQLWIEAHLSL